MAADVTTDTRKPTRPRKKRLLLAGITTLLALVVAGLLAIWLIGPRFNLYLVPPSPPQYVDRALQKMEAGYYATGPEWEQAQKDARAAGAKAKTTAETHDALTKAVKVAGGKHSGFFKPGEDLSTGGTETLPTVTTEGCATVLKLPALTAQKAEFNTAYAAALTQGVDAHRDSACGWIVDVRGNHGGDAWPMVAGLGALIPDGELMSFVHRDGHATSVTLKGGTPSVGDAEMESADVGAKSDRKVAVLTDGDTASSAEIVTLAFKGLPNARSFGAGTAGYSSANDLLPLPDGATLMLTVGLDRDRTGAIHGGVIEPDQPTEPDQVLPAALAWLQTP